MTTTLPGFKGWTLDWANGDGYNRATYRAESAIASFSIEPQMDDRYRPDGYKVYGKIGSRQFVVGRAKTPQEGARIASTRNDEILSVALYGAR